MEFGKKYTFMAPGPRSKHICLFILIIITILNLTTGQILESWDCTPVDLQGSEHDFETYLRLGSDDVESQIPGKALEKMNWINQWHFARPASGAWRHLKNLFQGNIKVNFLFFIGIGYQSSKAIQKHIFRDFSNFFAGAPNFWSVFCRKLRDMEIGSYKSIDWIDFYIFQWF